jgi:E3 ubiquitin-protein ligase HUWE1
LYVIDACAHHRAKLSEIVAAVGANVNHGILISLFRDTVRRLTANEEVMFEVVDAMMSLVAYVATSPPHSNQIIGAGIVPLLLEIPKTNVEKRVNVSLVGVVRQNACLCLVRRPNNGPYRCCDIQRATGIDRLQRS